MNIILMCISIAASLLVWGRMGPSRRLIHEEKHIRARDGPIDLMDVAADIELFSSSVEAGFHPAVAARILAQCSPIHNWEHVAYLLERGNENCWTSLPTEYEVLAHIMSQSHSGGTGIAKIGARAVENLRNQAYNQIQERSSKAAVLIVLPLGICFLPAFIILGLVPIIMSFL